MKPSVALPIVAVLLVGSIGSVVASAILFLLLCICTLILWLRSVNLDGFQHALEALVSTTVVRRLVVAVLLLGSIGSLVAWGILGLRMPSGFPQNWDGAVLFAAGRTWMEGCNPYAHEELLASVVQEPVSQLGGVYFFYPPQTSPFCLALASFPYAIATKLWLTANLLSIAALVLMSVVMIQRASATSEDNLGIGLLATVIIGNAFTSNVVWMGQTSLVATALAMASWLFQLRKHWLLAGIFLALASFKPQLCILLGVWFLVERDWKTLLSALAAGILLCLYPMVVYGGPVGMLEAWMGGIDAHKSLNVNQPGAGQMVGLESLLVTAGLSLPGWIFTLTGMALAALVWVFRHRLNTNSILGILIGITLLFVGYTHDYDYVALVPLFVALWLLCRERPQASFAVVPLLLLLFLNPKIVRDRVNIPLLLQYRNVALLLLTLLVIFYTPKRPISQKISVVTWSEQPA